MTDAVTVLPAIPKVTLFELENTTVPPLALAPAAEMPTPPPAVVATEAVIVEPFRPKETPFELEKMTDPRLLEVVPAEKLRGAAAAEPALTVTV